MICLLLLVNFIGSMEAYHPDDSGSSSSEENSFNDENHYEPALLDMTEHFFSTWEESQVFIYENTASLMKSLQPWEKINPYPDCFGTLLTSKRVLTTASCFMNVKEIRNVYNIKKEGNWISQKVTNWFNDKYVDPSKFIVALVYYYQRI